MENVHENYAGRVVQLYMEQFQAYWDKSFPNLEPKEPLKWVCTLEKNIRILYHWH